MTPFKGSSNKNSDKIHIGMSFQIMKKCDNILSRSTKKFVQGGLKFIVFMQPFSFPPFTITCSHPIPYHFALFCHVGIHKDKLLQSLIEQIKTPISRCLIMEHIVLLEQADRLFSFLAQRSFALLKKVCNVLYIKDAQFIKSLSFYPSRTQKRHQTWDHHKDLNTTRSPLFYSHWSRSSWILVVQRP